MPKANNDKLEKGTKLIFKNSRNTINTYSKTYSDASQFYTKSLILQLKQNLSNYNYYEKNGTIKRDLSIETDFCIMRGYYKRNRNKLINRETISTKSKYSANQTEIDTINELDNDISACGDSETGPPHVNNAHLNVNLTTLVIENLRYLLNDWIRKYLLENSVTKQKIETVLDSLLHKLDLKRNDTSSSCTYTIDIEVIDRKQNQKLASDSILLRNKTLDLCNEQQDANKMSFFTIPLSGKCLRILSTLSVPKSMYKRNRYDNTKPKLHKIRHKKIFLSTNKSSNYITSSNLTFLRLPTKFLTKRCATYERDKNEKTENYLQKMTGKQLCNVDSNLDSITTTRNSNTKKFINDTLYLQNSRLNTTPIIYNSIYHNLRQTKSSESKYDEDISLNNNHYLETNVINKKPVTSNILYPQNNNEPLVTIDFVNQSYELKEKNVFKHDNELLATNSIAKVKDHRFKNKAFKKNASKYRNRQNKFRRKSKRFSCLVKKSNNNVHHQKEILTHLQSIFEYFQKHENGENIKFDVHISVVPINNSKINNNLISTCDNKHFLVNSNAMLTPNDKKITFQASVPFYNQNIITLLDSAASHAKFIVSRETSTNTYEIIDEKSTNQNSKHFSKTSKIAQEISEIKLIIKSLAATTEKLFNEHLSQKNLDKTKVCNTFIEYKSQDKIQCTEDSKNLFKLSKGVQISSNIVRSGIVSGVKLKKEPRKKSTKEYKTHLMKKSTSYHIFESESILKVTDMTSAMDEIIAAKFDKALTCSLPKSKSLFEISLGMGNKKIMAFYCDDCVNPEKYICNISKCSNFRSANPCKVAHQCTIVNIPCTQSNSNLSKCCNEKICSGAPKYICTRNLPVEENCANYDNNISSSSICIDIDDKNCDSKKIIIRSRRGVSFWEGCLYCILLWIPALLISWLFYVYVLKEWLDSKNISITKVFSTEPDKINKSHFTLTLTDLGF